MRGTVLRAKAWRGRACSSNVGAADWAGRWRLRLECRVRVLTSTSVSAYALCVERPSGPITDYALAALLEACGKGLLLTQQPLLAGSDLAAQPHARHTTHAHLFRDSHM
jgi:hypothetical protein